MVFWLNVEIKLKSKKQTNKKQKQIRVCEILTIFNVSNFPFLTLMLFVTKKKKMDTYVNSIDLKFIAIS